MPSPDISKFKTDRQVLEFVYSELCRILPDTKGGELPRNDANE
jgi:hypothetical protein